ncbi:hypothetical protein Tdes44962_MAKER06815 [Teratosphaeria destructans]|uniref:Uncharacterized protein n=1 Tax=Teratosphaeria destructans TaxID=418781 RepID=A0A9W7T169_9PEZI|nr:hypothetical protein Tdes44962_MAKER06815 [Teratosphaeria destructans]
MAIAAQNCPVVGTITTVLSPSHPSCDGIDPELCCPITNSKVGHHDHNAIHNHPSALSIPSDKTED